MNSHPDRGSSTLLGYTGIGNAYQIMPDEGGRLRMSQISLPFTVDTHVFRELGELLVGRDSTALLELIKNAYDADATVIIVTASDLGDVKKGQIVVEDNGHGMDQSGFANGFLRIAARFKEEGPRRSERFQRRYTGSKGIGRLAAHKLSKFMEVESVRGTPGKQSTTMIRASIDWERIEEQETLNQLTDEVQLEPISLKRSRPPGTVITLSRLRRPWSEKERVRFVSECRAFQVPEILASPLPTRVLSSPLLFGTPILRDTSNPDAGCSVRLKGDFAEGDDYWTPLVDLTDWVLEIDCKSDRNTVHYAIAPSKAKMRKYPNAAVRRFEHPHPDPKEGPFFQARILVRDRKIQSRDISEWSRQNSGVRVYMEGFRVLPYGEPGDDWLDNDAHYTRRSWTPDSLFDQLVARENDAGDWQLLVLSNKSYTGAVFLTQEDAPKLRMLVNREGFVAERSFDLLMDIVKRGVDLLTRTRAAATAEERRQVREERDRERRQQAADGADSSSGQPPVDTQQEEVKPEERITQSLPDAAAAAVEAVREVRRMIQSATDSVRINEALSHTQSAIAEMASAAERVTESASMLRVLASLGMQMASFVHEIRGLLGSATTIHESLGRLREDRSITGESRKLLNQIFQSLGDQRRQIERQASYLVDIASADARRRRTRQRLSERFESATQLIALSAERRGVRVLNEIPRGLISPPMFPAELTAVFSNLLTNALKAAGEGKTIRARGEGGDSGGATVVIENTGVAVDLADSEKWFKPFESSTVDMDSTVGQGMGLGLTITRDILEQYGASIQFVKPAKGYATAVEIVFPGAR